MPRIVDGDNLLGSWPGRKRSTAERRALAREVGRLVATERRRIVLVFDGEPATPDPPGSDVLFSGAGRRADELILSFLRRQEDRAGWTLVTNDRSLGDQARWLGAKVERCDIFRRRLPAAKGDEKPQGDDDLPYWLELFEKGPDEPTT
jgi:hypothetical protein